MDVDIDFKTDFDPISYFKEAVRASMVKNGELVKHPAGAYFQSIPVDPITTLSAIPYDKAEEIGYFKIDFLHLSLLDYFDNKQQIRALLKKDPDWSLLQDPSVAGKLFQIHRHYNLLSQVKPKSVEELADCIALIRPGKRALLQSYLKDPAKIRPFIYRRDADDKSAFRKSHSIAYALTIVLQLHLIKAGIM
jgi:DNA polymerase III alpha subunit